MGKLLEDAAAAGLAGMVGSIAASVFSSPTSLPPSITDWVKIQQLAGTTGSCTIIEGLRGKFCGQVFKEGPRLSTPDLEKKYGPGTYRLHGMKDGHLMNWRDEVVAEKNHIFNATMSKIFSQRLYDKALASLVASKVPRRAAIVLLNRAGTDEFDIDTAWFGPDASIKVIQAALEAVGVHFEYWATTNGG